MKNIFATFQLCLISIILSSCGEESVKVEPMKKTDRDFSCSDIMLEINDAEFYKKQAQEKKSIGVKSIVMPLGYIDTYMDADEAIIAAQSRKEYLTRVFEIKGCGTPDKYIAPVQPKNSTQNFQNQQLTPAVNNENLNEQPQIYQSNF